MSERTVYIETDDPLVYQWPEERQVSVPWCVTHDSPHLNEFYYERDEWIGGDIIAVDIQDAPMCDKVAWTTDDEGKPCDVRDGVVWKVVNDE